MRCVFIDSVFACYTGMRPVPQAVILSVTWESGVFLGCTLSMPVNLLPLYTAVVFDSK
jgi:hypothetical protein